MYDKTAIDEMLAELERKIDSRPAWVSMGPESHHALRIETAELVLQTMREKHPAAFASALSEVMTGQPITIGRPRSKAKG
jgi:hypothetical protein